MLNTDLKSQFKATVAKHIHREGCEQLMNWLEETDFYTAPASTRFHGAHEGGLVMHSLNVHSQLLKLSGWYQCEAADESIAIVSLFHDLCKVGTYKIDLRWRKNASNQWEQYTTWRYEEDFAYGGHGSKSVFLVQHFMPLLPEEAAAINSHMGVENGRFEVNDVYRHNQLAWLLHVADEAAAFIVE